jgi:hypothetical protein
LFRTAVPPELAYGKLQIQEIPPVRGLRACGREAACFGTGSERILAHAGAQNATLTFDIELLSIKKDNPFGKSLPGKS